MLDVTTCTRMLTADEGVEGFTTMWPIGFAKGQSVLLAMPAWCWIIGM